MKLKLLDLFSGLGGFSLGLERTGCFKTVAFCEIDKYCTLILNKHWKGIKVYDDVRKITKEQFDADGIEYPDIITGGFPCQPFSVAGKQKGTGDDRHLWPEMFRIIKAFKPKIVIGENVKGIINIQDGLVFETVCTDLENEGYEVQAFNIPAAGVQAPHRRERIWIIATNVGNSEYDGSLTTEITRGSVETSNDDKEGQNATRKFPPGSLAEQVQYGTPQRT
jgi:DNA (cytosine-5)-methyltransferase 1